MADAGSGLHGDLLSSVVSDIKTYNGRDPLLPWIRGIRRMKDSLPPGELKQKLPRFLQKCAQTFENDRRYTNDLRYLRVWLQLMDFVDDPRAVVKTMEANRIGMKTALFYQAYALYYEKMKKFDAAERMYRLGVQNLAEPVDELQKSYVQFLGRMERHKSKRTQRRAGSTNHFNDSKDNKENESKGKGRVEAKSQNEQEQIITKAEPDKPSKNFAGEDTIVVKFVGTAIVGKSEAEDARHHGLVEPTINTKEAMNAINNMFREPIDGLVKSSNHQNRQKEFLQPQENKPETFHIFTDEEDSNVVNTGTCLDDPMVENESRAGVREDTFVYRFVGSTILDDPKVENVCHHGLVDPTVNLKEAMNDINSMFGKPIDFVRKSRSKKEEKKSFGGKGDFGGFLILPDDDDFNGEERKSKPSSDKNESDLFEPTVCMKEAMDDINKMFAMPLDF